MQGGLGGAPVGEARMGGCIGPLSILQHRFLDGGRGRAVELMTY